jgi:hypothetical protein
LTAPADEEGSINPPTKPDSLQSHDKHPFYDKVDLVQSLDQDTISAETRSSAPLEPPHDSLRISLQYYQNFENYDTLPGIRVTAKPATKSPPGSVWATKIPLQNQENISDAKGAKDTLVERKYRTNLIGQYDELFRILPVQHKTQIKGYSGSRTSERRTKMTRQKHTPALWRRYNKR